MIFHDFVPFHFSYEVPIAPSDSLIDKLRLLEESNGIPTNQVAIPILYRIVLFIIKLKPNLVSTLLKEYDLVDLI